MSDVLVFIIHLLKLIVLVIIVYSVVTVVFPPLNFPDTIPTIPFYVSFLGTYTSMDQQDIYHLYLKDKLDKYGAVKIYFASRWNILVTRPSILSQVLKDENTFAKSGNQKKIPYSVLSDYTGDNVISAHGSDWRTYRNLIQKGIQFPYRECVLENCDKLVALISHTISSNGTRSLQVGDFLQRFALANISKAMLSCDFKTLEIDKPSELHTRLKFVKSQIFKPLYMNFPVLDKLPIPSRIKARKEVALFRQYFAQQVKLAQLRYDADPNSAAYQLYQALQMGEITEKQFTDNAIIIVIAGHENPQLLFTSLLYLLAKDSKLQQSLREDLKSREHPEDSALLTSFLFEALRYLPPLGQIINRETSKDTLLNGNIFIPKGTYVGYNNFITGRDQGAWGTTSEEFKPERWGTTYDEISQNYKKWKSNAQFSSFHGGKRACLGERFALFESRMFVRCILQNFELSLSEGWEHKLTSAGPISPLALRCDFKKL